MWILRPESHESDLQARARSLARRGAGRPAVLSRQLSRARQSRLRQRLFRSQALRLRLAAMPGALLRRCAASQGFSDRSRRALSSYLREGTVRPNPTPQDGQQRHDRRSASRRRPIGRGRFSVRLQRCRPRSARHLGPLSPQAHHRSPSSIRSPRGAGRRAGRTPPICCSPAGASRGRLAFAVFSLAHPAGGHLGLQAPQLSPGPSPGRVRAPHRL
jgi:hypothetical protein